MQNMASYDLRKLIVGQMYRGISQKSKGLRTISTNSLRRPYDYRAAILRFISKCIGTPYGQRTGSVRYLRTICGDIRLPYDRLAFLYENVDKWQIKKSHDARMNCKHIRRSPRSHTMSKNS